MKNRLYNKIAYLGIAAAMCGSMISCDDDVQTLDPKFQMVHISQALEEWDGQSCNMLFALSNEQTTDTVININLGLAQHITASKDCNVTVEIAKDSLEYAIENSSKGGIYDIYKNALLMDDSYYELSSNEVKLLSGEKESAPLGITIHRAKLLQDPVRTENENAIFVLPVKLSTSDSYSINPLVSTYMIMVQLPQIDPTKPDPTAPKAEIDGMKLLWNDEFNGTGAPNPEYWNFEKGFVRNNELQWYQENNAQCDGEGNLVVEGRKERVKNPNYEAGSGDWKKNREYAEYTSSSITTSGKFIFKYGRLLVRAKIPYTTGAWPAIWTLGNWWEWPLNGEIDILELYLKDGAPHIHANACWGSDTRWSGKWNSASKPLADFVAQNSNWVNEYHIWRMDWDEDYIRLYVDDELMNEIDLRQTVNGSGNGNSPLEGAYNNPFSNDYEGFGAYILLNLALGSNGGTPDDSHFPLKYYIDYVRVYQ